MFRISKGAIAEGAKSSYIYKHGAIAFNKGKPIGRGYNSTDIHGGLARDYNYRGGIHAEVAALKNINKADTILVVRISREDGSLTMSRPCEKCQKYLKDRGIKKVVYSNWNGEIEEMRL